MKTKSQILRFIVALLCAAGCKPKAGDADTAELFTEVSRDVDKLLWFVHLQPKE